MHLKSLLLMAMAIAAGSGAQAVSLSVSVQAGGLASAVENAAAVTSLTVTGTLDATDFDYMRTSMPDLTSLDLSGARVATITPMTFTAGKLASIKLPTTATAIGDGAFAGCALQTIDIPATVTSVGDGAFSGCTQLRSVSLGSPAVGAGAFSACPALASVDITAPTRLAASAFKDCTALAAVGGSSKIVSIGDNAFNGDTALAALELGPTLRSIGSHAFAGSGITGLDISGTALTGPGSWSMAQMPQLTEVTLGNKTMLGTGALFSCPKLTAIHSTAPLASLPDFALALNPALTAVEVGDIAVIGAHALAHDTGLNTFTVPATVDSIGTGAMAYTTALTEFAAMPDNPPVLGDDVWEGVDQASTTLKVPINSVDKYHDAAQWQEFHIVGTAQSAVDTLTTLVGRISARFDGDALQVLSHGAPLSQVWLYDLAGHLLAQATVPAGSQRCTLQCPGLPAGVYAVSAALANGTTASFKLQK